MCCSLVVKSAVAWAEMSTFIFLIVMASSNIVKLLVRSWRQSHWFI